MSTSNELIHPIQTSAIVVRGAGILDFLRRWLHKQVVHHYQVCNRVSGYVFEVSSEHPGEYLMTAYKYGVKQGDVIEIHNAVDTKKYQVQDIDYYTNPPEMWCARLSDFLA